MSKLIKYSDLCGCTVCHCILGNTWVDPDQWKSLSSTVTSTNIKFNSDLANYSNINREESNNPSQNKEPNQSNLVDFINSTDQSIIKFGDWILKHNINMVDGLWSLTFMGEVQYLSTLELYQIYLRGYLYFSDFKRNKIK